MTSQTPKNLPRWDLSSIYPGLDSSALEQDLQKLGTHIDSLEAYMAINEIARDGRIALDPVDGARTISGYLDHLNATADLYESLEAYLYGFISTDSYNQRAAQLMSTLEPQMVRIEKVESLFKGWLGELAGMDGILEEIFSINETASSHSFILTEMARQSRFLMSDVEESLAAELSLSGANAWMKLHGVLVSQLKAKVEIEGEVKELPLSMLNIYVSDPDEKNRRSAYLGMEKALAGSRESLAACLNGVKGSVNTLNEHRGRPDALDDSLDKSRIDRSVLETMIEAMESASPIMLRYRKAKAKLLGKDRLEQWDLPAPVGDADRQYSWDESIAFISTHFATYSSRLEELALKSFERAWIDAEPRDGKQVGAFCMRLPTVEQSRVLLNFDGRLGRLSTLAHELGHAYHNECLRGKSNLQAMLPMTLAETASIFCENIVTDAILAEAYSIDEELAVLDSFLSSASYLTLELYSRFLFEREIFIRRERAQLSADDFCDLCSHYYHRTLGDTIVEGVYRPYDWAILPHYYSPELSFYNYPYTFGFLFSLGLYQLYKEGRPDFHQTYDKLLADSGSVSAVDLGLRVGIDIREPAFWAGSYQIVQKRVERYEELVEVKGNSSEAVS